MTTSRGGRTALAALFPLPFLLASAPAGAQVVDRETTSPGTTVNAAAVERIPSARDPWTILRQTPGVLADRANPGGSGAAPTGFDAYRVDGIVIGGAEALGDVQVTVGGSEPEYGTGGVSIDIVTNRGTSEWSGPARYPGGVGGTDFEIRIDATGSTPCLDGFGFGGTPPPLPFALRFDAGSSFGRAAGGPSTPIDLDGDGTPDLHLDAIPGCEPGAPGLGFVRSGAPAPGVPSHLLLGGTGVQGVDLSRVEDTHVFSSNFYLSGLYSVVNGGFQLTPGGSGGVIPESAGTGGGMYLLGLPLDGTVELDGQRMTPGAGYPGAAPFRIDFDGDGNPDTPLFPISGLGGACPGILGGAYRFTPGAGGGAFAPDPRIRFDCGALEGGAASGYRVEPSTIFNTGNLSHELKFGAGYRQAEVEALDLWPTQPMEIFTEEEYRSALDSGAELGGPIIRDRLWIWGSYQVPEEERRNDPPPDEMAVAAGPGDEPQGAYARETLTAGNLTVNLGLRYGPERPVGEAWAFNPSELEGVPLAPGIQDGGAEIRIGTGGAPAANGNAPGGAAADDSAELLLVARGGSTGEVFDATLVAPDGAPIALEGLVAIEPVAMAPDDRARLERRLARSGGEVAKATVSAYCLQFLAGAPPAGTVFRIAGAAKQAAFAPAARALDAARRLKDAGRLAPDTNPEAYFHSIRQWSVWTLEQRFDRAGFLAAFEEHARKSLASTGRAWTEPIGRAVRASAEARWTDVTAVLAEAGAGAGAGAGGR